MPAAFVQSVVNNVASGSTSVSVSVPSVTAGSVLVCGASGYLNAASTITSVTDDKGNTWAKITDANITNPFVPANRAPFNAWYCENAVAGTTVVTASGAGSGAQRVIMVQEFSGLLTSGALDKFAGASSVGLTATMDSGNTATLTKARQMVVGIGGYSNTGATPSAGSGYSNLNDSPNVLPVIMESKLVSATTAVKADITLAATRSWGMIVATFKELPQPLLPPVISTTAILYAPTLAPGSVTIAPPLISAGSVLYTPTLVPGSVTISPPLITSTIVLYPPDVAQGVYLLPPFISSGTVLYAPTLSPQAVALLLPFISSGAILYAPAVPPVQTLLLPLIASTMVLYPPSLSIFNGDGDKPVIYVGYQRPTAGAYIDSPVVIGEVDRVRIVMGRDNVAASVSIGRVTMDGLPDDKPRVVAHNSNPSLTTPVVDKPTMYGDAQDRPEINLPNDKPTIKS